MRELQLFMAPSLDGYIAGAADELDWLLDESSAQGEDYGCQSFMDGVDTLVMGRHTWEISKDLAPWAHGDKQSYVFSSKDLEISEPSVRRVGEDAAEFVRKLKEQAGKHIWLFGGGALSASLLGAGLVDRCILYFHPVLLGAGKPLFPAWHSRVPLRLVSSQSYKSGLVRVEYSIDKELAHAAS